jgi:THO complex subunit 3
MLCTAAADTSVRLWDVRGATQRAVGQINVQHGQAALAVEWSPAVSSHILAVTERNGTVYIYDTRKLSPAANATTTTQRSNNNNSALCTYKLSPYIAETCIFSPSGQHLVAGCSKRGQGVAELRIWPWKENDKNAAAAVEQAASYPAHTGPIYSMQFSPNGKHLVTGGSDAIVGLFDTTTMCCEKTFTKRLKFIRSTVFSHDSQLLAIGTEEDGIEIADVKTGLSVGSVSMGHRPRSGGAEEIAWHPKEYIVACARTDIAVGGPPTPATVAKLTITS